MIMVVVIALMNYNETIRLYKNESKVKTHQKASILIGLVQFKKLNLNRNIDIFGHIPFPCIKQAN